MAKQRSFFKSAFKIPNHHIGRQYSSTNTGLSLCMASSSLAWISHICLRNFSVQEPSSTGTIITISLFLHIMILAGRPARQQQRNCRRACVDKKQSSHQVRSVLAVSQSITSGKIILIALFAAPPRKWLPMSYIATMLNLFSLQKQESRRLWKQNSQS